MPTSIAAATAGVFGDWWPFGRFLWRSFALGGLSWPPRMQVATLACYSSDYLTSWLPPQPSYFQRTFTLSNQVPSSPTATSIIAAEIHSTAST